MKGYVFRNENCLSSMQHMINNKIKVDCILTSPPYNISQSSTGKDTENYTTKYTFYNDKQKIDDYMENIVLIFKKLKKVLNHKGVMLINYSYASNKGNENILSADKLIYLMHKICSKNNLMLADIITWKKSNALPNNKSMNKCTRICEYIFVLCKDTHYYDFMCNKEVSNEHNGSIWYKSKNYNYIEAKNNDGANPYNKATFSIDFVSQLLKMYVPNNKIVYDPFGGTGTTAIACYKEKRNIRCICSELDPEQVKYSKQRMKKAVQGE